MGSKQHTESLFDNTIIRTILGTIFTLLFGLFLSLTIFSYVLVESISDKEQLRAWVSDEQVQKELVNYIIEKSVSPEVVLIAKKLAGEENFDRFLESEVVKENVQNLTELAVDAIHGWITGEMEEPVITIEQKNITKPIVDLINENLSIVGDILDLEERIDESKELTLLAVDEEKTDAVRSFFQFVENLPKVFLFLTLLFGFLTIFSMNSWRRRILMIGGGIFVSGVILFFAKNNESLFENLKYSFVDLSGFKLPAYDSLPEFAQLILRNAWIDVSDSAEKYSKYLFGIGLLLILASQLTIRANEEQPYEIEESDESADTNGEMDYYDDESQEIDEEE